MPVKNSTIEPGSIFIEGCEFKGISDFEADTTAVKEYVEDSFSKALRSMELGTWTATVVFSRFSILQVCGLWGWVIKNCPNRRVAHLINHGKTSRVRWKNFLRGMRIIAKELK